LIQPYFVRLFGEIYFYWELNAGVLSQSRTIDKTLDIRVVPKMIFREKEGATLILRKNQAEEYNLEYKGVWAMITLNVNSDLEAVGFLAKITEALAKEDISVNAVSAFHHDHLFVPAGKVDEVMGILGGF